MERILHPCSGESGFFVTDKEKTLIDIVFNSFNQAILQIPHSVGDGVDE